MSDLSSPRYNATGAYKSQIHSQRSRTDTLETDDLKNDYKKALNYIETLKSEQISLKNALRLALCEANSDYSKDSNSHRQSYHSTETFVNSRAMEKRLQELEQENQELKGLLETNSKKIVRLQKDQQDYLNKVQENETLHAKIDELNDELSTLNKEFCIITDKLLQVEVKNSDLLSQSIRYNQEVTTDRTSVLKYANYIYQLINSVDKNHFSFCCFEERFSKGTEMFNLIKSNDLSSLVLKAFKYITDLLININSQYFSTVNSDHTSPVKSARYTNQAHERSSFSEYLPDQNLIQKVESPQNYDMSDFDDTPTPNIVARLMERMSQKENERSGILKTDGARSPLKSPDAKGFSLDASLIGKFNSVASTIRSIDNSPKKVQFKVSDDNKYGVETEILEYAGLEDSSRLTSRNDSKVEEKSEDEADLVAKYKRELREKCKVIKENERGENQPRQQRMEFQGYGGIKESGYEESEENSMNYSEQSKTHKEVSVLEVLSRNSSSNRLKNFLKTGKDEKEGSVIEEKPASETIQKKVGHHSRQNYSEASSVKTGEMSESWHINPKLRDYQVATERSNKANLRTREKTSSLSREGSATRFTPVISPRMQSPKNNLTYQQINTARKGRAAMEEDRSIGASKRKGKQNSSTSSDARKNDYVTYSVAFSKNEIKSKCSPSPNNRVMSVKDIPKKKKVDSYPKQTYDVIRGQELAKPKK